MAKPNTLIKEKTLFFTRLLNANLMYVLIMVAGLESDVCFVRLYGLISMPDYKQFEINGLCNFKIRKCSFSNNLCAIVLQRNNGKV